MKKFHAIIIAFVMILSCFPFIASAAEESGYFVINGTEYRTEAEISSVTEYYSTVYSSGDTIEVFGKVKLPLHTETVDEPTIAHGGYTWVINKNNIIITGKTADASLYCPVDVNGTDNMGGMWSRQSTLIITSDNVSIESTAVLPNYNSYYNDDGYANKTIEITGLNFNIKNCTIDKNVYVENGTTNGGSLYFNGAKNTVSVTGCTLKETILSFDSMTPSDNVLIKGNTFDTPCDGTYQFISNVTWTTPPTLEMGKVIIEENIFLNLPASYNKVVLARMKGEFELVNNTIEGGMLDKVSYDDRFNSYSELSENAVITIIENDSKYTVKCDTDGNNTVQQVLYSLKLDQSSANINQGSSVLLKSILNPSTDLSTVVWTTSDKNVATVSEGLVSGIAAGSAVITASAGGYEAKCKITVNEIKHSEGKDEITVVLPEAEVSATEEGTSVIQYEVPASVLENTEEHIEISIPIPSSEIVKQLTSSESSRVETVIAIPSGSNESITVASINIGKDVFSEAQLQNKPVVFDIVNEDNILLYSWEFNEITDIDIDVNLSLTVHNSEASEEINSIAEDSVILEFNHSGNLPSDAQVRVYVGGYGFKSGDSLWFYYFNETTREAEFMDNGYIVDDDLYVTVKINHCSSYILTADTISEEIPGIENSSVEPDTKTPETGNNGSFGLWLLLIVSGLAITFTVKKKSI